MAIDPRAIVDPRAEIGKDVEIGPYVIVEAGVKVGDRSCVMPFTCLMGDSEIGPDCQIHQGAIIGAAPQIRNHKNRGGGLTIGEGTVIREYASVHRAGEPGRRTVVGRDCYLMSGCHIAHDCQLGDHVTLTNYAGLAGHVIIHDGAYLSGHAAIHQFVKIGQLAMISGSTFVAKDVPPFMIVVGRSEVRGINIVGMRRAGMSSDERLQVKQAYRILYRSGLNVTHAVARLSALGDSPHVRAIVEFVQASSRGICGGSGPGQGPITDDD